MIVIYTDGSCSTKTKSGARSIVVMGKEDKVIYAHRTVEEDTTNNRQELKGLLEALSFSVISQQPATIWCDSTYCVAMANEWIKVWHDQCWMKSDNKPVMNEDLVRELWQFMKVENPPYKIGKIKGHSIYNGNNMADILAREGIKPFKTFIKTKGISFHGMLEETIGEDTTTEVIES